MAVRARLREVGRPKSYVQGETLIHEGSVSTEVLLIESGTVKVMLNDPTGAALMIGFYGAGALIGELGVIQDEPRSATVIARDRVQAVSIGREAFRRLHQLDPAVVQWVNQTLYERLRQADRRQLAVATKTVRARVVHQLLDWAEEPGTTTSKGTEIRGISQQELAQYISASPKSVEEVLNVLREAGLVSTARLWFLIPDRIALARYLEKTSGV
ncbi:cAMP-binding protein [Actinoalloteichus hymeniacidonis]|uniref:cAMP-binding protein n=2 Tax=Actinoalloteichus hymeniacidonis TaxID=340345 RepID=A0AAC9HSR3_9PSEU|nr:cAMP-binding protein [Actinoalloteichus hymeniacidonis]